jgi:hypothetical protein
MNKARMDEAATAAREFIEASAPFILTATKVASKVATRLGVGEQTARKYLKAAVDDGQLLELKPTEGRNFRVRLPNDGGRMFRVVVERWHPQRLIIAEGDTALSSPSNYGPGRTTYMITPELAKAVVDAANAKAEAERKAEREKRDAENKAERSEIKRREPGLLALLRRLEFALTPDWADKENRASATAHLFEDSLRRGDHPMEERSLSLHVMALGDKASVLREILSTGLEAYLAKADKKQCAHCGEDIMVNLLKDGALWWHVRSTNVKCKGADTTAEPEAES